MKKKALAFVAIVAILVMMIPMSVFAAEKKENKLQVQQTTDKTTYSASADITTTLKITNNGDFDVNFSDIVMTNLTPTGYKVKANSKAEKDVEVLKTGETATLVTVFEKSTSPITGDGNIGEILFFGGMALLALGLILGIIFGKKKHKNITTIIICILVAGAAIFAFANPTIAKDSKKKVSLSTNVTVDKKELAVKSTVEYDVDEFDVAIGEEDYVPGQETVIKIEEGDIEAHATIPEDAKIPEETEKIVMVVNDTEKPEAIILEEGQDSLNVDISFYSVKEDGSKTPITDFGDGKIVSVDLSTIIPDGHELVKVFNTHNPTKPTEFKKAESAAGLKEGEFFYDSANKVMYLASSKFSPFTFVIQEVEYEVIVTKDDDDTFTPVGMSLAEFRDSVNEGEYDYYEGYTATLQKDVDLKNVEWEPIGYYYDYYSYDYSTWTSTTIYDEYIPFCGVFDGNNHTIRNLELKDPSWLGEATQDNDNFEDFYLGLFGGTYGAEIKNLTLKDSTLIAEGYGPYGMLVAEAYGTDLKNCHLVNCDFSGVGMGGLICDYLYYGTMDGCTTDSTSSLSVTGGSYSSGLVAYGYQAEIKNSINNANITGAKACTGIVGNCNQTTVDNCKNTGTIHSSGASDNDSFVGGIAGTISSGSVLNCINTAKVSTDGSNSPAGGIVAQNCSGNVSNITFSINTGDISGAYGCGIASGLYGSTPIENCYNSGNITGTKKVCGISMPVYSGSCNSEKCVSAGTISGETTYYLSSGTNNGSYYYENDVLKDATTGSDAETDDVLDILNSGLTTPFWGKDLNGIIKPLALIN